MQCFIGASSVVKLDISKKFIKDQFHLDIWFSPVNYLGASAGKLCPRCERGFPVAQGSLTGSRNQISGWATVPSQSRAHIGSWQESSIRISVPGGGRSVPANSRSQLGTSVQASNTVVLNSLFGQLLLLEIYLVLEFIAVLIADYHRSLVVTAV